MTEYINPEESLRKADEAEVAQWRDEHGEPLAPDIKELAVQNLAKIRENVRKEISKRNEGEQDD